MTRIETEPAKGHNEVTSKKLASEQERMSDGYVVPDLRAKARLALGKEQVFYSPILSKTGLKVAMRFSF